MGLVEALQSGKYTFLTTLASNVHITAGNGDNKIAVMANDSAIFTGDGDNQILLIGDNEKINSGNGDNEVTFWGDNVNIKAGDGDNSVETLDFAIAEGQYENYADYLENDTTKTSSSTTSSTTSVTTDKEAHTRTTTVTTTTITTTDYNLNGVSNVKINLGNGDNTVKLTAENNADIKVGSGDNDILVRNGYSVRDVDTDVNSSSSTQEVRGVYVFGNQSYPISTTASSQHQVDYSRSLVDEFTADANYFAAASPTYLPIFNNLSPEAQAVSEKYGEMFGKTVLVDELGGLIGVYDTAAIMALNPGIVNCNSYAGKSIKLPDGTEYDVLSNAYASPLTFDLDGDGIETSDKIVKYDIDGDGQLDDINDAGDAVLCFNGGDSGKELFGNNTDLNGDGIADGYSNGFEALKALAQKEGLINGTDDMKLDSNDIKQLEQKYSFGMKTNGYNGNVVSLESLGITEINLANTDSVTTIDDFDAKGNRLMTQTGATFEINGETRDYADVWNKIYNPFAKV